MAEVQIDYDNIDDILKKLSKDDYEKITNILYGKNIEPLELPEEVHTTAKIINLELKSYRILGTINEQLRPSRLIRVGLFQHALPLPPNTPIIKQRAALYQLAKETIELASKSSVDIICFQEAWNMPFAFCTREKQPWCEYAETIPDGVTIEFLKNLAKLHNITIISPILERDNIHGDTIWNTAVIIDNNGKYMGKHRKNHIPRVGDFNESTYYMEGNTGHPVFIIEKCRFAVNICYGRHHPLNWLMFNLNGAEIVFNPSATVGSLSEPLWGIEARNAAIANSYYTCAINRVGVETYDNEFTSGDGGAAHKSFGKFYGSSFVSAPNGSRTPSLSRHQNGLLIVEFDLNLNRQIRDHWGFQMTQRLEMYVDSLKQACQPNFQPQQITSDKRHL